MTPERHAQIKQLFLDAAECPEDRRAALLDERCGDDSDLRARVESLLEHHRAETLAPPTAVRELDSGLGSQLPDETYRYHSGDAVGERFRVVAPLGAGGMGEVYRALDLTLTQEVALKFLRPEYVTHPAFLKRFYQEARVARTVTHPNICRVFDVGEADGQHFLSMEYIDGENLGRLLKRIGRLPQDKAVDIARQMCSGLAAAHARGILHRDLKPANIMLDGQGQARITDFGLAGFAQDISGAEIRAGTPAYMAPEQIKGQEVTVRSDIYSLGLVLYELFSGQAALPGKTAEECARMQTSVQPPALSQVTEGIDPRVERVIMRCIEKDPAMRPGSVLEVAQQLPGSDVLGEMIAAHQTPTPEMVAAAAPQDDVIGSPTVLALICVALLGCCLGLRPKLAFPWQMPGARDPVLLAEDARKIIGDIQGEAPLGVDTAYGYCSGLDAAVLGDGYVDVDGEATQELATGRKDDLLFWFRQSPVPLVPVNIRNVLFDTARVTIKDPPHDVADMVTLAFDTTGRLLQYSAIPPALPPEDVDTERVSDATWGLLLAAAHISDPQDATAEVLSIFTAAEARGWKAAHPEPGDAPRAVSVSGVGREGRPLFFSVAQGEFADDAWLPLQVRKDLAKRGILILVLILTIGAMPIAIMNDRSGRGDRIGAMRLGMFMFMVRMVIWLLHFSYDLSWATMWHLCYALMRGLGEATLVWIFYMALEPYARRTWPHLEIGWKRVLALRSRDPAVGRHVLVGVMCGLVIILLLSAERLLVKSLGWSLRPIIINPIVDEQLLGGRFAIAGMLDTLQFSIYRGLLFLLLLSAFRRAVHRQGPAAFLAGIVLIVLYVAYGAGNASSAVVIGLAVTVAIWAMIRYGLVAIVAMIFVITLINTVPLTLDGKLWYFDISLLALTVVTGLAGYGWWAARAVPR